MSWKADQSERQTVGQTADDDEASASRTIRESPLGGVRRQLHTPGLETLGDRVTEPTNSYMQSIPRRSKKPRRLAANNGTNVNAGAIKLTSMRGWGSRFAG